MKKVFGIISIIVVVLLAIGGGVWTINKHNTQKTYQTELKAAQKNVNDKNYSQAVTNLNNAKKISKGNEKQTVNTYLKQVTLFMAAQDATNKTEVKENYQKVKNIEDGYAVLRKRAVAALDKLAEATASSKVSSAVSSISSSSSSATSSSKSVTSSSTSTSNTSKSSSAKSTSKKASSKATQSQNEGVGSADSAKQYSKDSMGKTITGNEVSQARATLKKANIDDGAFPDSDIKKFIKEASNASSGGLVQVVKDYLKNGE